MGDFIKGSSRPKQKETIESKIRKEILTKQELRLDGMYIHDAQISNVVVEEAKPSQSPDCNYYYKGRGTIRIFKPANDNGKRDYQEYPESKISGYAQIDKEKVTLINGTSIDSGIPRLLTNL